MFSCLAVRHTGWKEKGPARGGAGRPKGPGEAGQEVKPSMVPGSGGGPVLGAYRKIEAAEKNA